MAAGAAGPVWDKTKDVAGDVVVKAAGAAGPAIERSKAVAGTVSFVVAGTVGELKEKIFGASGTSPVETGDPGTGDTGPTP